MTTEPSSAQSFLLFPWGLILDNFCLSRLALWLSPIETMTDWEMFSYKVSVKEMVELFYEGLCLEKIRTNIRTNLEDFLSQEDTGHVTRYILYLSAGPISKLHSAHIVF